MLTDEENVMTAVISPDGAKIASISFDKTVSVQVPVFYNWGVPLRG